MIIKALFFYLLAFAFAGLEVEAEGKHGWAEKMPTWYRNPKGKFAWDTSLSFFANLKSLLLEIFGAVMDGKPLTGYHLFMMQLPLLIFHMHFVMGAEWSVVAELQTLAIYFAFIPVWDYLWFVLNPAFTAEGFTKEDVWWHGLGDWTTGRIRIPVAFVIGWDISLWLSIVATFISGDPQLILDEILLLSTFLGLLAITVWLSPYYHEWYESMRESDDREELGLEAGESEYELYQVE